MYTENTVTSANIAQSNNSNKKKKKKKGKYAQRNNANFGHYSY